MKFSDLGEIFRSFLFRIFPRCAFPPLKKPPDPFLQTDLFFICVEITFQIINDSNQDRKDPGLSRV